MGKQAIRVATSALSERQLKFAEWLATPRELREPKTQREFAALHNIPSGETQLSTWKRDPAFRAELERRCDDLNMHPERVQDVMDALFKAAKAGDVKAATLYLQQVNRLRPQTLRIEQADIESLSDEEFKQELVAAGLLDSA